MTTYHGHAQIEKEICWECTGSGIMAGNCPCKICMGTGYSLPMRRMSPEEIEELINKALKNQP